MNLIMLDIDGTLTRSYEYDQEIFCDTIAEVTGVPFDDTDWHTYEYITSSGVTPEAIYRATGRPATSAEIDKVQRVLLARLAQRHRDAAADFIEVPGASRFIAALKQLDNIKISIATGCWRNEARFKLSASNLDVRGIPMATCEDSKSREEIMATSCQLALAAYEISRFENIVYLGDGIWDAKASAGLGYRFIGIGKRLQTVSGIKLDFWHEDYSQLPAVLSSIKLATNT